MTYINLPPFFGAGTRRKLAKDRTWFGFGGPAIPIFPDDGESDEGEFNRLAQEIYDAYSNGDRDRLFELQDEVQAAPLYGLAEGRLQEMINDARRALGEALDNYT